MLEKGIVMAFKNLPLPSGVEGKLYLSPLLGLLRNFEDDEQEIHDKDITTVIRLLPDNEVAIKSPKYYFSIKNYQITWEDLNYSRYAFPNLEISDKFFILSDRVTKVLKRGKNCLIHCLMGKVRTGTLAAAVLIRLGVPLEEALRMVEETGSIATSSHQKSFLEYYASVKGERDYFFKEKSSK
jgi:protein-tyrosine phosphatase